MQTLNDDLRWKIVLERDAAYDGQFVFAVQSTGIYCRPSCPSRRPVRARVRFYATPAEAQAAGFRACKRCHPDGPPGNPQHAALAARACHYLEERRGERVSLAELAAEFSLSPYHFQRVFCKEVGLSPHQYAAALRDGLLRSQLKDGASVTAAALEAGFPAPTGLSGRLGMRPSHYRNGARNMHITYTFAACPLGYVLVAATQQGFCAVILGDDPAQLEADLAAEFPAARRERADAALNPAISAVLAYLSGARTTLDLPLDVRATAFQERVWRALRSIPYGETRTYREIAETLGQPGAARAVAHACASNPVALVTPCHRVIGADGALHGYRWGIQRKRVLLALEKQPVEAAP